MHVFVGCCILGVALGIFLSTLCLVNTLPVIQQGDKLRAMAKGTGDRVRWEDKTKDEE